MALLQFPRGFLWGSATSAHQVEGNCDRNHWWDWEQEGLRAKPPHGFVADGSVSGIACDYFHRYDEDHALAASLGHRALRISIEWSRIEPEDGRFDPAAVDHYKRVCDSMIRHGLEPTLTLHHFTNPTWTQRRGGWENPEMIRWLSRFADFAIRELGDRARLWWTINEPTIAPILSYLTGVHPPCVRDHARALVVAKHVLLAHGAMYEAMKGAGPGSIRVGPVLQMPYFEPFDPNDTNDVAAAEEIDLLTTGYVMAGLREGILVAPVGRDELVPGLKGSADILGVNYYLRSLCREGQTGSLRRPDEPETLVDEMGWEIYPEGLYRSLVRAASVGCPVYVTENGMATLDDEQRARHLREHLERVWRAIRDGVNVAGYFYWSLIDNFEWAEGYARHFGLVACDRRTLERRPKPAASLYREVIAANALDTGS